MLGGPILVSISVISSWGGWWLFCWRPFNSIFCMKRLSALVFNHSQFSGHGGRFFIARQRILSDEVRAKNMTFASLVEMAEEAAYLQNLDRSYRYISSAITDMTGYDVKTFYQTPNLFADLVYEEDFPKWLSYEKSVAAGRTPDAIEVRLTTKHKGLIWVRHVTRPIFDGKKSSVTARPMPRLPTR